MSSVIKEPLANKRRDRLISDPKPYRDGEGELPGFRDLLRDVIRIFRWHAARLSMEPGCYRYVLGRIAAGIENCLILRVALAVVYIWFGILKPLGISPANELITRLFPWMPSGIVVHFIGFWEIAIGLALLSRRWISVGLVLMALQLAGTLLPLFLLREICFTSFPLGLSLEGQYIIKNLVLMSAGLYVANNVARSANGCR